jgi:hypothetical protein
MCWKDVLISLGLAGLKVKPQPPRVGQEEVEEEQESDEIRAIGDTVAFEIRLAETIEWCLRHADISEPGDSLRNEALKPEFICNEYTYSYNPAKRIKDICQLLEKRRKLLSKEVSPVVSDADLQGGKLLAFFPDETLCDGAAEMVSYGFFDVDNVPAWDTWVGIFRDYDREYIVSYIPNQFVSLVEEGTDVNPEDCIPWLDKSQTRLARKLMQKGIIPKKSFRFRL